MPAVTDTTTASADTEVTTARTLITKCIIGIVHETKKAEYAFCVFN